MDLELKDKVAIVTGGSQGIGKAAALRLAAEGASVVIAARGRELLDQVAAEIRAAGGSVAAVQADVSRAEDCARLVAEAVKAFGRLDILVNNAGTSATGEFESVTDEHLAGGLRAEAVRRDPARAPRDPAHEAAGRRAHRQHHQYRRQAAARQVDADHGHARRGPRVHQGAVEGVRAAPDPGEHHLHRPGARRAARNEGGQGRHRAGAVLRRHGRRTSRSGASGAPRKSRTRSPFSPRARRATLPAAASTWMAALRPCCSGKLRIDIIRETASMSKAFDLAGRVAIVTGGNGGIGLGMATGLAQAGAALVIAGRNAAKNAAAVKALRGAGREGRGGRGRRDRAGRVPRAGRGRARALRPARHPRQQRRHQHPQAAAGLHAGGMEDR